MTVLEFRRPDPPKPAEDPLYFVTIYPNATIFTDPNNGACDKDKAADALFDSTFHVWHDYDECVLLLAIGSTRSTSMRAPDTLDTPAQKEWLRRRFIDSYRNLTGEPLLPPSILDRIQTFFRNLISKGDPE